MSLRARSLLLLFVLFVAVVASSEDAIPEITLSVSNPSPVKGQRVELKALAADTLVQRAMDAPLMIWLERLEERETGVPVDPETEDATWMPIPASSHEMNAGMFAFTIETADYAPGAYAFRVVGGLPTEPSPSEVVVVTVAAQ